MKEQEREFRTMRLDGVARGSRGVTIDGDSGTSILGITEDSREVQPGFLFSSLKGNHTDGANFVADALRRGAAAILLEGDRGNIARDIAVAISSNARKTLAEFASAFYDYPSKDLIVVGVTGTNGKTTTSYLLRQLLQAQGISTGWISTVGYALPGKMLPSSHTTPCATRLQGLMHQMRNEGCKAVAMEASSHALDQYRAEAIAFDVAVFTNLTRDHLDYHGNFENYLKSKIRLFEILNDSPKRNRWAVINAEDPAIGALRRAIKTETLSFGIEKDADVMAKDLQLTQGGALFELATPVGRIPVLLPLLGRFNVQNALAMVAAGVALRIPLESIAQVLSCVVAPPGRMEFIQGEQPFRVVVDYAHTDDALRNVLATVREFTQGRVLLVFGCGGDRDKTKRPLMGRAAQEYATMSFLTSDNPRSEDPRGIIADIERGFTSPDCYRVCVDRADAIEQAIAAALPGDLVLIAGKGHEEVQITGDRVIAFSDKAVAGSVLQREGFAACKS